MSHNQAYAQCDHDKGMINCRLGDCFKQRKTRGEDNLPVLSVTIDQGVVRRDSLDRRMTSELDPEGHLMVKRGDLVYNMMRMWQGAVGVAHEDGIVSPAYVVCSPDKNINPLYAYFLLKTPHSLKKLTDYSQGITKDRLRLYFQDFEKIPITIHPLKEQEKIAQLFETVNKEIGLIGSLISAKQERRKWLMQRLLTSEHRLQGFVKKWQEVRLGDIFTNRSEPGRIDLPLVAITVGRGVILRDELDRKDSSSEDKSKYLRICPGDIGYNTMRMWQGVSALSSLEGIVSPAYTIVTPNKGVDGEFMAILFRFPPVVHLFYRYSQGLVSDTWNLKFRHFSEIKVRIPEEAEQKAIANVFRVVDKEIALLQSKTDALREQKKGLMQQLLAGKVRVNTTGAN